MISVIQCFETVFQSLHFTSQVLFKTVFLAERAGCPEEGADVAAAALGLSLQPKVQP